MRSMHTMLNFHAQWLIYITTVKKYYLFLVSYKILEFLLSSDGDHTSIFNQLMKRWEIGIISLYKVPKTNNL